VPGVPPARYAYLGPAGTFTEQALQSLPAAAGTRADPYGSVALALDAVRTGEADGAVVPFENSVEGSVSVTLDELATGEQLMITREMTVQVRLALLARSPRDLASLRTVATHPHAAAQARRWLADHVPGASVVHVGSTAMAAAQVAGADGHASEFDAAVAAPIAAERYRLTVLADSIGANPDAVTRFVLVSRPGPPPPATGDDRTSLAVYIAHDRVGALLAVLMELAVRGVNMTRIESRPTGEALGRYAFFLDTTGHVADDRMGEALRGLRRVSAEVRFLGSYPRHRWTGSEGDGPVPAPPGQSDVDYADAAAWLDRIRKG
jgi:prephenate dehydratase